MIEKVCFKRWAIFLIISALLASFPADHALASEPALWSNGLLARTSGGVVNPALLVAFNPQPEPPAWTGEALAAIVDGALEHQVTNISNPEDGLQNFQFLFAVASDVGLVTLYYPPDPIDDFRLLFNIYVEGSVTPADFTAIVDVQSSSGGSIAPGSAMMFNPQPEPPAFGFENLAIYGLDFGMTSLSDVTLRVRIEDSAGNPLNLIVIPEPTAYSLCILAMVGWGVIRRRVRAGI